MSNYLKKILFSLLILMMPYMNSTSKAMLEELEREKINIASPKTCQYNHRSHVTPTLIEISTTFLKDGVDFAIKHPIQTVTLSLASLFPTAEALDVSDIPGIFSAGISRLDPLSVGIGVGAGVLGTMLSMRVLNWILPRDNPIAYNVNHYCILGWNYTSQSSDTQRNYDKKK